MTKNRKRVFMTGIVFAALIVLGTTTVSGYVRASKYRTDLQYNYQRAMRDLTDCVDNMELTLSKGNYANTAPQQIGLAAKLMRESSMAKASLAVLPLESGQLENVGKYITQVGDFAMTLSSKISGGGAISEEERASMKNLQKYAGRLKDSLQDGDIDFNASGAGERFNEAAEDFTDYPTLIYDGPFSDHIAQRKPRALEGAKEILQGNAQNAAAVFLGMNQNQLAHVQDNAGNLPTYNFNAGSIRISVTKAGGAILSFTDSREIGAQTISEEEAKKAAQEFLVSKGISSMKESYFVISDGICTINYAYLQDGVICYPDLIKVSVGLDTGSIVEYSASGYLMNHVNRQGLAPKIDGSKALAAISPALKPTQDAVLAVIPTPGMNEALCYEFICTGAEQETVLVYINAGTGMEEQILILTQSDNGVLVK